MSNGWKLSVTLVQLYSKCHDTNSEWQWIDPGNERALHTFYIPRVTMRADCVLPLSVAALRHISPRNLNALSLPQTVLMHLN